MSSRATFFIQGCPTCGRKVRVCVEYLGVEIQCRHCHALFVACDPDNAPLYGDSQLTLMQRVDELLGSEEAESPFI